MSNIYTLDLQKNIWYCRGLRDVAYFPLGCSVEFTK